MNARAGAGAHNNDKGGSDMQQPRPQRRLLLGLFGVLLTGFAAAEAAAQSYPSRNITIIIPFPAGGLNDGAARLLQPELEKALGRNIIIENRGGAAGVVGSNAVAKSEPDGHTLLMIASSYTVTPAVNPNMPYEADRDLVGIAMIAKDPLLFVVHKGVAAKNLSELIALARAEPGKLNYASPGYGSQTHFLVELLSQRAGVKMQHVPYRGGAPAMGALAKGEADFSVISAQLSLPQIEAGAIRAIAVGGQTRDPKLPNVPTAAESGFPGFEAVQWIGMLAPRGTPKEIIDRLNRVINEALSDPSLAAKFATYGMTPARTTPEEFQKVIETEVKQWKEVAKSANIKPEP
jgi:tripartite-type tricarboxylate transporter receptor subunit TctC